VKKEEISLPLKANPPIKGKSAYTVFDVMGEPKTFTPSFHVSCRKFDVFLLLIIFVKFKVYHERFHQFLNRAEALYDCG